MHIDMFLLDLKERGYWFKKYFATYFKAFFALSSIIICFSYLFYESFLTSSSLMFLNKTFNYDFSRFAFSIMCLICILVMYLILKPISLLCDSENSFVAIIATYCCDLLDLFFIFLISMIVSIIIFIFITVSLGVTLLITVALMLATFTIVALIKNFMA